ncbi:MAG: hypothetical protein JW914_02530 [Syntrophaceae bacterium]|nr:hypothetical protein [Syntrophaceae bacterium]
MKRAIKNKSRELTVILRKNSLDIAILATLLVIIVFISASTYLYLQSPSPIAFRPEVTEYFQQKQANRELKTLQKYAARGEMVVAEEAMITSPYEKQENKPASVKQPKAAKLIAEQGKDSEQVASLAPDKEPAGK